MDIFATRLKELRVERGLTQKKLAKAIDTTDDSIFSWEKGRSQPSLEMLRSLCICLDISADYLLGLDYESGGKYNNSFNNFTNSGSINIR